MLIVNKELSAYAEDAASVLSSTNEQETIETEEQKIRRLSKESYDKIVLINGRDYYYYAQNNPVFNKTRVYDNYRVGETSCSATAIANVIINTLDYNKIGNLLDMTYKPIRIDTKCIQSNKGLNIKQKFTISEDEDIAQYLPICILNIVTDNNKAGYKDHRNTGYYDRLLKTLGLEYKKTRSISDCLEELKNHDKMIVTCTGGTQSPIAPKFGHYFVMADIDDEYVYFMDSLYRDKYPSDKEEIIEICEPGIIRCKIENIKKMALTGTKYIVNRQTNIYTETQQQKASHD